MFGKRIVLVLVLLSMMLTPLLSQDSQNLATLVAELEIVIEKQTKLLKDQQNEIDNLVILSAEQKQELLNLKPELKKSKSLVIEQQSEIERLQILANKRPEFFQNYAQVSSETIIALRDRIKVEAKALARANTIKDISLIGNVGLGIALFALYASK